jgi:type VI secretion system protein VasG
VSRARNVDAFLNQRILPTLSRELLTRIASGTTPERIVLSSSAEGNLTIDFVDCGTPHEVAAEMPAAAAI